MTASARRAKPRRRRARISPALRALRRAARVAYRLAQETGTPFYVWKDGKVVDLLAKLPRSSFAAPASPRQRRRKAKKVAPSR
jgi:hypothetical protein